MTYVVIGIMYVLLIGFLLWKNEAGTYIRHMTPHRLVCILKTSLSILAEVVLTMSLTFACVYTLCGLLGTLPDEKEILLLCRMVLSLILPVRYLFQKEVGFPFLLFYMNMTIFSDLLYQGADILHSLLYPVFLILHALFCVCDEERMQAYRKTVRILTEEDIDIIAIHEAGHAVMSMNDGVIPVEIVLLQGEDGLPAGGYCCYEKQELPLRVMLCKSLAGDIAAIRYGMLTQKMVYSELSSVDDHSQCFELLQQVPRQERYTLYEDCRKHCTQVLYAHWDLVSLTAQRLLEEKKLERQELELLWQTYGKEDGMDHEDDRRRSAATPTADAAGR
ncbi:hypothetical protein [[Clostridium] innocuum]|uniref:hypothetical protein n=1 Tax=Clostridium innocuum TaxID=1522 RepID=UPI003A4E509A